ncbi:S46 family peptidase [Xanthomonas arboricola]|uniref:S46 family peptidase n=1 Tax=Xanthomonas arboricola TaxID=56448 RepID=UPI000F8E1F83|nr:S46 family peptidase [Xanthomonas arboricola]
MKQLILAVLLYLTTGTFGAAFAEEGMWPLDRLPLEQMQQSYGFSPDQQWVHRVQRATVRLAEGCSGSFVSGNGLVMTNHHCANACLSQLSKQGVNYMANGFGASRQEQEPKCPDVELNQLDTITDVTAKVNSVTEGKQGSERIKAERAIGSQLEQICVSGDPKAWRCDMVSLYHGGRYAMYKYRRYQDVRLVFAPEQSIAFFGGDPDNFNFPRYDLDVTFVRAYVDGKPARTPDFLRFRTDGPKAGEMTFVVGNPGSTEREMPWLQLSNMRENHLIPNITFLSELRGVLWQYSRGGEQQAKETQDQMYGLDNSLKIYKGWLEALNNQRLVNRKKTEDDALREWIASDEERKAEFGDPWAMLSKAQERDKVLQERYNMIVYDRGIGVGAQLYKNAMKLVRAAEQRAKPDAERLPPYREANLPAIEQSVTADVPVYPQYEQTLMAWSMEKMRQALGTDDSFVIQTLGKQSPVQLAKSLVEGTKLADPALRKQLWEGGAKAIAASDDPMIVFARGIEPVAAEIRKQYEEEVEAPTAQAGEAIAQARFARDGTSRYPDATFTPRLTYGKVVGWREVDHDVEPFTYIAGLYARATDAHPYKLPDSWIKAKGALNLTMPMNFVTDNDIIGGNSGSPVIDREGRAVGLIFDGNIHSLGGNFFYDGTNNRAVAVDAAALVETARKVYRLPALADELVNGHL